MKLPSSFRVFVRWLKRRLPGTLFGRSLLIIVLPVALMQIAVTYVFFDAHWQTVTARLSEGLAGDIAWAVESYKEDPTPESFARLSQRAEESMSLSIALQPGRKLHQPDGQDDDQERAAPQGLGQPALEQTRPDQPGQGAVGHQSGASM